MSNYIKGETSDLFDPTSGQWLGVLDKNGNEQLVLSSSFGEIFNFNLANYKKSSQNAG